MTVQRLLDDASAEALLGGGPVPADLEALAEVVAVLRSAVARPVPPTPELARRMAMGGFADRAGRRRKTGTTLSRLASMSLRAKVATGLVVGLTGLTGATAAGALPDAAQQHVETAIESVTPIEFPDRAEFGQEVADDARDGGVDGQEISEKAQEQGQQPDGPGKSGEHRPAAVPGSSTAVPPPDQIPPGPGVDLPEVAENRRADTTGRRADVLADPIGVPRSP